MRSITAPTFSRSAPCATSFCPIARPFRARSTREIERKVLQAQPAPLASLIPGLDPEIDTIVTRALAKDRNQRYQSVAQLGEALESCRLRLGPANTPPLPSTPPSAERNAGRTPHVGKPRISDRLLSIKTARVTPPGDSRSKRSPKIPIMRVRAPSWRASNRSGGRLRRHAPSGRSRQDRPPALRTSAPAGGPPAPDPPTLLGTPTDPTIVSPRAESARRPCSRGRDSLQHARGLARRSQSHRRDSFHPPQGSARTRHSHESDTPGHSHRTAGAIPRKRDEPRWTGLHSLWMGLEPLRTRWRTLWQRRQPLRKRSEPPRGGGGRSVEPLRTERADCCRARRPRGRHPAGGDSIQRLDLAVRSAADDHEAGGRHDFDREASGAARAGRIVRRHTRMAIPSNWKPNLMRDSRSAASPATARRPAGPPWPGHAPAGRRSNRSRPGRQPTVWPLHDHPAKGGHHSRCGRHSVRHACFGVLSEPPRRSSGDAARDR